MMDTSSISVKEDAAARAFYGIEKDRKWDAA